MPGSGLNTSLGRAGAIGRTTGMPRCGQGGVGVTNVIFQIGPGLSGLRRTPIFVSKPSYAIFGLSGVTKDATGAPLAGCTVNLFADGSNTWLGQTISDGSGNFSFVGIGVGSVYITAYLAGAPEVAGITIHNLVPVVVG